jgi:sirohydrochlorin ferrochelatase
MEALLLIAHGSRRQQSNQEVTELADQLREACDASYEIVHAAFLELASPSIGEGISLCVDDGASRVTLLPYFLNSGRHVVEDIPEIVGQAKIQHPDIDIVVAPHLGASSLMVDLLIDSARSANPA